MYQLIGAPVSLYTGKVRSYLKYKGIGSVTCGAHQGIGCTPGSPSAAPGQQAGQSLSSAPAEIILPRQ